jgi:hypothetical protein
MERIALPDGCQATSHLHSIEVRMRQSWSCLISAIALTFLGACGSERAVTPLIGLEGEYALETVNGVTLPFLKGESGSERVEVISGSLTLRPDRTYSGEIVERWTTGANIQFLPETSVGTFTVSGNKLTFTEGGSGRVHHGTMDGDRLRATMNDVTFGFVAK